MNGPLAEMLRYNSWATNLLLEACRSLADDHLDVQINGGSGTVRETLLHLVGGQQTFVLRTKGRQHEGELNRDSRWPGWEALVTIATATGDELMAAAESLEADRDVVLPYGGGAYRYPLSFFLVHAVAHGAEHRSEIKLALAQLEIATPDLDGWEYANFRGYGEVAKR